MIWFRFALREIRNNSRFSWFFIINLTLGLVGFIALDSFKISIHNHISGRSKAMLSADLDIRSTRLLSEQELTFLEEKLGSYSAKTRQINFLSMVSGGSKSRLVQIVAVDRGYPLYGQIRLSQRKAVSQGDLEQQLIETQHAWIQPELLLALGLEIGSQLTIGKLKFKISDTILESTGESFWSAGIAYKVFIGLDQAEKTGLIQFGSRRSHHYLYKLAENIDVKETAERLNQHILEKFGPNPYIYVRTHFDADRQMKRLLGYLSDYLGLVSMVALFLAGVGTAYLFRSYLGRRMKEIAILMSLGATREETYLILLIQITILGTASAILASFLAVLLLPLLTNLLQNFLPKEFTSFLSWQSIVLAVAMGLLGSVIFCLPILTRIRNLKPQVLFRENQLPGKITGGFSPIVIISYLPLLLIFWFFAVWQAHSWKTGTIFMLSLISSSMVLGILGWLLLKFSGTYLPQINLIVKLAFRNLSRNRIAMLSSFLAIGLGALLINLIPQIHKGLQEEIKSPNMIKLPTFFLFDIQPEQVTPLKTFLKKKNHTPENVSAWINARLLELNGKAYGNSKEETALTREQQRQRHTRRHGQNISYRLNLYASERIVAGKPFSGAYDAKSGVLPEISLEHRFAERLGAQIGDSLTFDIQGITIKGKIVNTRRVKWNSFQPNFFIIFQPGVLEDAPSTFLATLSQVKDEEKVKLQNEIINLFPNISMVDISMAVEKILEITRQISWAIQVMAFLAVFTGMIVVFSISRFNSQGRQQEINLLKVLGANFNDIRQMIILEFGMLGLMASLVGAGLSLIASWIISMLVFESLWSIHWPITILTVIVISLLSMTVAFLGARKTLGQKPAALFHSV